MAEFELGTFLLRRAHIIVLPVILFFLLFAPIRYARAAFGISPPFLNADHLVKGARYVQVIYLVQDQPNEDLPIRAELNISPTVRPWVSIDKGFDFVIPKGVRQFPVEVVIQVPKDAGLGIYSGTLSFSGAPGKAGQVTIALGAQVSINLTVGTGIYQKFTVPLVKLLDIEEGWNPRVYVKFNNEGNVPEAFTGATYELYDQFGAARLAFVQKNTGFDETPAFTVKEYTMEFPTNFHLGLGQYWGSVTFFQKDKAVASQRTVFNVLPKGSLASPGEKFFSSLRDDWYYYGGGAAVLLALGARFYLRRKKVRLA